MSYAGARLINDAHSHLMALPDFLSRHVDARLRGKLPDAGAATTGIFDPGAERSHQGHPSEVAAELEALGDNLTRRPKRHDALGAFKGSGRGSTCSGSTNKSFSRRSALAWCLHLLRKM